MIIRVLKFGIFSIIGVVVLAANGAAEPSIDAGMKIYTAKCVSCHAKDGKGNAALGKVLKVDLALLNLVSDEALKHTDADRINITTNGLNKMPPYKGKLKDDEIASVVAYVRSLAPSKP